MTWDPVPRMLLFLSNLLLVFARINSIVFFMYSWGPGEFKPGMIAIGIHIFIMMVIHLKSLKSTLRKERKKNEQSLTKEKRGKLNTSILKGKRKENI